MSAQIKKKGGFPPKPPTSKKTYDNDGFLSDKSHCEWVAYKSRYARWEKYCKPFEEVFGVPFKFIDEPDYKYLRKKQLGLIEPLEIEYDGSLPFDNIEITIKRRNK